MPNFSNKFYFIEWNILFYVNFDLQKVEQKLGEMWKMVRKMADFKIWREFRRQTIHILIWR